MGRCGRFPAEGDRLCSVHDPKRKAATAGAREVRKLERRRLRGPLPSIADRDQLVREIAELAYFWDGPGSEGRCV